MDLWIMNVSLMTIARFSHYLSQTLRNSPWTTGRRRLLQGGEELRADTYGTADRVISWIITHIAAKRKIPWLASPRLCASIQLPVQATAPVSSVSAMRENTQRYTTARGSVCWVKTWTRCSVRTSNSCTPLASHQPRIQKPWTGKTLHI